MARILFFGKLQDQLGKSEHHINLPNDVTDTSALLNYLDNALDLKGCLHDVSVRIAVNNTITTHTTSISDNDEIAFLPPVGGG